MHVTVIGLGRMGLPVAIALTGRHEVAGIDLDAERVRVARAAGIAAVREGGARSDTDVVLTVLRDDSELADVMSSGMLRGSRLWIDLSSCDPRAGARLHAAARQTGVKSVAAPMLGGPDDVGRGTVGFLVAGEHNSVTEARPLLEELGSAAGVQIVGDLPHDAYLIKLLGNLLWFGQVVTVSEVLLLATRYGLDPARVRAVLAGGPGSSVFLRDHAKEVLTGQTMDSFGLDRVVQELRYLTKLAEDANVPFGVSEAVTQVHEEALERLGALGGELGASELLQQRARVTLRQDPLGR